MDVINGTHGASKFTSEDVISSLPDNVITTILHCLPIQDAVKTGILSRDWKFKWTMMTQLVFDKFFLEYLVDTEAEKYHAKIISRLLLHLKGAITKFDVYIDYRCCSIVDAEEDVNNWVMFLSRKGIKEFTLINMLEASLKLHTHIFSCLELKHLELFDCCLRPMPSFRGFSDLLSLDLEQVIFESYRCGEFLTRSPFLEILEFKCDTYGDGDVDVKQVEIAKLENLKMLSLPLYKLENIPPITSSSIFQLMGSFPKLQRLTLDFWPCKLLADARKRGPASLPCLKILHLLGISDDIMLSCAIDFICGSPNLQTLQISATFGIFLPQPGLCSSEIDFSRVGQLQLREVVLKDIGSSENELCLIKSLLAASPLLKKMVINPSSEKVYTIDGEHGEMMFATKLLEFSRASTIAVIKLEWVG